MADRPRIELRLGVTLGRISNPLGYHYPTGPYKCGFIPEESTRTAVAHIHLYTAPRRNKCLRRRRAGLMAIRADFWRMVRDSNPHVGSLADTQVFKTRPL